MKENSVNDELRHHLCDACHDPLCSPAEFDNGLWYHAQCLIEARLQLSIANYRATNALIVTRYDLSQHQARSIITN